LENNQNAATSAMPNIKRSKWIKHDYSEEISNKRGYTHLRDEKKYLNLRHMPIMKNTWSGATLI
jgi:hypothetical protein